MLSVPNMSQWIYIILFIYFTLCLHMKAAALWRHCLKSWYGWAFQGLILLNEVCWRMQPKLIPPYSKRLCWECERLHSRSPVTATHHPLGLLEGTGKGDGSPGYAHAVGRWMTLHSYLGCNWDETFQGTNEIVMHYVSFYAFILYAFGLITVYGNEKCVPEGKRK